MRVTVEEIAKIAGVSKATVSRVLNSAPGVGEETRNRVQAIINRLHYSNDGQRLRTYSRSIALIVPDISNPFFSNIAYSVEKAARVKDYIVIFANTDSSEKQEIDYIRNLVAKKVDGIILVPSGSRCLDGHHIPQKYNVPMVLLDRKLDRFGPSCGVYLDNKLAVFRSCEVLIQHGADKIAFISGPLGVSSSIERLQGYQTAINQYHAYYSEDLIQIGNYTVDSGYNAIINLEQAGVQYQAVLAANDLMAIGALNALKELSRRVPEDVELIGFDNIAFSRYSDPPLSTIQQPTVKMGVTATELLLRLIHGERVCESIYLQPKLLLRKTTK